jgi:hypothetical protein
MLRSELRQRRFPSKKCFPVIGLDAISSAKPFLEVVFETSVLVKDNTLDRGRSQAKSEERRSAFVPGSRTASGWTAHRHAICRDRSEFGPVIAIAILARKGILEELSF